MNLDDAIAKADETLTETEPVEAAPEAPAPVEAAPESPAEETKTAAERARDEAGRFAKAEKAATEAARKPEGTPAAKGKGPAEVITPAAAVPAPAPKPPEPAKADLPRSLSARARELAAKAPPEFKPLIDEIAKRDHETTRALNESHQARQFAQQVQQSLSVYAPIAQANGKDVMTWAGEGLQSYAALMQGAPEAAVNAAAQAVKVLMQRFGQPAVEMLAAAVEGKGGVQPAPQPPVDVNTAVQQALEARIAAMQEQRGLTEAQSWIESKTPDEQDEIRTLMPAMVGIIQAARSAGAKITYDEAHAQARWANPDIRSRLIEEEAQKRLSESTAASTAAAQKAKAAAVSIKSSSTAPKGRPAKMKEQDAMAAAAAALGIE